MGAVAPPKTGRTESCCWNAIIKKRIVGSPLLYAQYCIADHRNKHLLIIRVCELSEYGSLKRGGMYITGLLLAWVLNVQDVQGWLHDKKAGYYDYPARIYGAVNVAIINGIDSKPLRLGAPHEPGPEFKQLETYLNSGGANIRNLPGCREMVQYIDVISNPDL